MRERSYGEMSVLAQEEAIIQLDDSVLTACVNFNIMIIYHDFPLYHDYKKQKFK